MRKQEIIKNVIRNQNVLKNQRIVAEPNYRDLGAILLFIFLLPYIISFFFGNVGKEMTGGEADGLVSSGGGIIYQNKIYEESNSTGIFVCNTTAAGTETMPLETYLVSRLPSTINMNYEIEALKAQVIVLRTELMRACYGKKSDDKPEMDDHNNKYNNLDNKKIYIYTESNIVRADGEIYEKAKKAVDKTRGMYMTYGEHPIKAPYFALSAGATRNGNEVFDSDNYSYLKSVMCERDFTSEEYNKSIKMGSGSFFDRLNEVSPGISAHRNEDLKEILNISRDRAGYVTEIGIGDKIISGEMFRDIFSLSSSSFEIGEEDGKVSIKTKGVGHGLGFCQYAANESAKKGSDFIDILNYFFSDIAIEKTE